MKLVRLVILGMMAAVLAACSNGGQPPVQPGQVGQISISPATITVEANESKSLSATVKDSSGNTLSNVTVSWEVTDTKVAKVTAKGKSGATLTGLKSGETEVYAVVDEVQSDPVEVVVSGDNPGPGPGPGPTPGKGLSGTLYAPSGGDVKDTLIIGCVIVSQKCDVQDPRTKGIKVGTSGKSYSFSVAVEDGEDYLLLAWKDINGSKEIDDGDYAGCNGGEGLENCTLVRSPEQGLELRMAVLGGGNPGPGPTPGDSSISGQLFAATSSPLRGTIVLACNADDRTCSPSDPYTGTATQAPYTVSVPSGDYFVLAWRDANGSGEIDTGDDMGCVLADNGSDCDVFAVNGAVTGKDIHLAAVSGGGGAVQALSESMFGALNLALRSSTTSITPEQLEHFLK
jgi:hypothetical protein